MSRNLPKTKNCGIRQKVTEGLKSQGLSFGVFFLLRLAVWGVSFSRQFSVKRNIKRWVINDFSGTPHLDVGSGSWAKRPLLDFRQRNLISSSCFRSFLSAKPELMAIGEDRNKHWTCKTRFPLSSLFSAAVQCVCPHYCSCCIWLHNQSSPLSWGTLWDTWTLPLGGNAASSYIESILIHVAH